MRREPAQGILGGMRTRGLAVLLVVLLAGLTVSVSSYVLASAPRTSVKVCVAKGIVVSSTNGKCPPGAKLTTVNKRGPAGPPGPAGSVGPSGQPGSSVTGSPTAAPSVIDGGTP